jgi:hypothetical protein
MSGHDEENCINCGTGIGGGDRPSEATAGPCPHGYNFPNNCTWCGPRSSEATSTVSRLRALVLTHAPADVLQQPEVAALFREVEGVSETATDPRVDEIVSLVEDNMPLPVEQRVRERIAEILGRGRPTATSAYSDATDIAAQRDRMRSLVGEICAFTDHVGKLAREVFDEAPLIPEPRRERAREIDPEAQALVDRLVEENMPPRGHAQRLIPKHVGVELERLREGLGGLLDSIRAHQRHECPGITPKDCLDAIYEAAEIARHALDPSPSSRDGSGGNDG